MLKSYVIIIPGKMVLHVVNYKNMTIQELIDKLNSFDDKNLDVCFPYVYGMEAGDPLKVEGVFDLGDLVILSESNEYY